MKQQYPCFVCESSISRLRERCGLGPQFLDGWASKMWSRFFCLSVYVTMYLNDHQRSAFYESLGLNTTQFNRCRPPCAMHRILPSLLSIEQEGRRRCSQDCGNKQAC